MTALPPARVLDVTPDEYHRLPGFSASLAKILIAGTAAHAKDAHDRQAELAAADGESDDEDISDEKRKQLDNGSIRHALVLGIGKRIEAIPSSALSKNGAYGTAEAKALRDAARKAGRIPVKEPDMPLHQRLADIVRDKLAAAGHVLDGTSEMAIEWWEPTPNGPVQCRAMLDHVVTWGGDDRPVGAIVYDLKFPGGSISHERCERTAESLLYGIQAAAYPRALNALHPSLAGRIEFRFLFCESRRPFEIWDPVPDGMFRELGEQRWRRALLAWAAGQASGMWPGLRTPERKEITAPLWALKREGFTADE